jgi:Domain of unknown function (DUF1937)
MTFWYLSSPYSKYKGGLGEAHRLACWAAAGLLKSGTNVYSPIAHTHDIAIFGGIDPYDHKFWLAADEPFMRAACGLIVLTAPGWDTSDGMAHEMTVFHRAGKPVRYLSYDPDWTPVLRDQII